ncbi:MAG: Lrp/AsnC family transcriptional regulator [Chloroflexota bacterium]|nr:Lrp/AsnC family transcriptional regulator [Chloroflexota bacterium]
MNLITLPSKRHSQPTDLASAGASHRALVAAAARLLTAGDRADRAAFLARTLNGLADVVPMLGTRALQAAAHASSEYQALLDAVNSPEVATAWQANDPFAAAHQRAAELKRRLLEAEGGALTVAQVAKRLGISKQAVDKRRRARKLVALETSRGFLYPTWQFADARVLPGLEAVLAVLEVAPWTQASWFLTGDRRLGDGRPLDALRRGEVQHVVGAAAAYGEQGAG